MRHRPRSLVAVLVLTALSLLALALTGVMEWLSAILFLVMEFTAEFLRPLLKKKRRRPSRRAAPATKAPPARPGPVAIHRVHRRRHIRARRPVLRGRGPGRGVPPT